MTRPSRTARAIRKARRAVPLTQAQLADGAGVQRRTAERWESPPPHNVIPSTDNVRSIAAVLGVDFLELEHLAQIERFKRRALGRGQDQDGGGR